MPLKISLKPNERLIIGGAVIANTGTRCDLIVENKVPILRQKDILAEHEANTPCRRIYFVIQLMYIDDRQLAKHHEIYWKQVQELLKAVPSMLPFIDQISEQILSGNYYKALKLAHKLIKYEQEVLGREQKSTSI